jgi:phosphatidylserine decarboxylase
LSRKQGIKYDAPESALDIPTFIEFHKLDVNEILDPLSSFSMSFGFCYLLGANGMVSETFNEFFYRFARFLASHTSSDFSLNRKLKMSTRPVENHEDPYRLVSGADCRLMAFETVHEATQLWIKGREFTVARLLGDVYKREADRYHGGALAIFRLAPQDYHRFHSPVDGTIGPMAYISGEYYTVNVGHPLADKLHFT